MSKTVVVYKSKYGSTEKYARWISEATGADIYKAKETTVDQLREYDTIVYCGGLYAGGLLGFKLIKNSYDVIKEKNIIVVAVGATLKKVDEIEEVMKSNLTDEMLGKVQFFLLRGGLDYKRMGLIDRVLMFLLYQKSKRMKASEIDNDTKGLIATYGMVVDFTNKNAIKPIVSAVGK